LILTPLRASAEIAYDIASNFDAYFLENSGVFRKESVSRNINYFGGLDNILPLFYMIRFYKDSEQ